MGPVGYHTRYSEGAIVDEGVLDGATAIITRVDDAERTVYEVACPGTYSM